MPRGGYHPNAERWGRPNTWLNASGTKTIRVPSELAEQVLEIAHKVDRGESLASVTEAKLEDRIAALELELKSALNLAMLRDLDLSQKQSALERTEEPNTGLSTTRLTLEQVAELIPLNYRTLSRTKSKMSVAEFLVYLERKSGKRWMFDPEDGRYGKYFVS